MFFPCINICRVSRKLFELEAARPGLEFKHLPRDLANVNAMKQLFMIVFHILTISSFKSHRKHPKIVKITVFCTLNHSVENGASLRNRKSKCHFR